MIVSKLRLSHLLILFILGSSILILSVIAILAQGPNRNDLNDAEKFIWDQVSAGKEADLKKFGDKRQITAKFLENLLTGGYKDFKVHRHGVTILNATIIGPFDLTNADIPCGVDLRQCDFQENVNFSKSRFRKDLSLIDCQFDGEAYFSRMDIEKGLYIWGIKSIFKKDAKFDRITIGESIFMETTTFKGKAIFSKMRIKGDAYLGDNVDGDGKKIIKFYDTVDFTKAAVEGLLDFGRENEGTTFNKGLDFSGLKVGSHLALRSAEILGSAKFNGATIGGDLKAQKAQFAGPLDFSGAEIGGQFIASNAKILSAETANFQGLRVAQGVNFQDVKLNGSVDFTRANIGGPFLFEWSKKEKDDTTGHRSLNANKVITMAGQQTFFLNDANFRELIIRGPIKDESRSLKKEDNKSKNLENLQKAEANGVINLEKTTIERRFLLEGIAIQAFTAPQLQVKGLAAFDNVTITHRVDLQNTNFQSLQLNKVTWPNTEKKDIKIDRLVFQDLSSLGYVKDFLDLLNKSSFDKKSYLQLEDYLKRQNQNELADDVFKNEQQREIEDRWKNWPVIKWFKYRYGWLTGYGRSYYRILELSLLVIFFGALWLNPDHFQSGRAFPNLENRKLLRLLLSFDIFLPNVPQKVTDLTKFPRIELGLENSWQPPKNFRLLNAYVWVHKTAGVLLFIMLFPAFYQFIKKFLEG